MSEIILAIINIILLGGFGWYVREQSRERAKLINAILAKDSHDYVQRTLAENTKITPEINGKQDPDLVPMDQLSDELFDKHIQQTLGNNIEDQEVT
jgi:hypothetical protein